MAIKTSFSIKDLENLSGVKAHTIRIWEKRYKLLEPERTDSNIRTYNNASLQKILNIAVLNKNGIKISKISSFNEEELFEKVKELTIGSRENTVALNDFKIAMLNFDQFLFEKTYNRLLVQNSFRDVFLKEFIVLLQDIGDLWTTDTIDPMHERFISTLIKQKILINIERIQPVHSKNDKAFILFLPLNEMHDIGLLYLHFELILKGYKSIFLGTSIPTEDLRELQNVFSEITYVSYFTIEPSPDSVIDYLNTIEEKVLSNRGEQLHILGRSTLGIKKQDISNNIKIHESIINMIDSL